MPLVIFTGYPSSGKTTRAKQLQNYLTKRIQQEGQEGKLKVTLINDETLQIPKTSYYDSKSEKAIRGQQMTATKRELSQSNIVILDNLCYIKGYRYQLFCEAKALMTNSCVVDVLAPVEQCKTWNKQREDPWPEDLMDQLIFRYEEPNQSNRWDSPLFSITHEDTDLDSLEESVFKQLYDVLIKKKPKPPNQATVIKKATSSNFLYDLDKKTQDVVSKVLYEQKQSPGISAVIIDREQGLSVDLPVSQVSLPQLQRLRRSFITLNKMRTLDSDRITPMFVDYLNKNFQES